MKLTKLITPPFFSLMAIISFFSCKNSDLIKKTEELIAKTETNIAEVDKKITKNEGKIRDVEIKLSMALTAKKAADNPSYIAQGLEIYNNTNFLEENKTKATNDFLKVQKEKNEILTEQNGLEKELENLKKKLKKHEKELDKLTQD